MPDENVLVPAPQEVLDQANVQDWEGLLASAAADPIAFWEKEAGELEWSQPWDKVLDDSGAPFYKWFTGARTNIVTNAIDRHLSTARRNKLALIWVGEDTSKVRTFSYFSLNREVEQMANILLSMGVTKGDVVTIYLPRIPEIYFAMLACAKIGAIHSVVFAGYSSEALNARIDDSESRVVITVDGSWINGSVFPMKKIVDDAVRFSPTVENVIVVRNTASEVTMDPTRDHWYHELARLPIAQGHCPTVQVDAEDPLFILYTSGSTGKPKAAVHTHGGYQVHLSSTMKNCLDIHEADRWWCTADPGWITGTSYVIYAPLIRGATTFMAEGSPVYPYPDVWWQLVEHYGINGMFTAPTAIRTLMRFGDAWVTKHDLSTLRILVSAGEPLNPEAWRWFHEVVGQKRCAVIDNWWQTETGAMQITSLPAMPKKPGSAGRPIPGQAVAVLDEAGHEVPAGTDGFLVLKNPWPSMLRTLFKEPDRYVETYWTKYPGVYLTGDSARIDEDGYVWIIGRTDDVIKVSGHRIGTAEVEAAVNSHPAVAECAAIGLPHEVKGNAIHVLAVLNTGYEGSNELVGDIRQHVSQTLSPIAKPDVVEFVDKLPKTRSGKIMRRVLRARALGEDEGDLSTLENG
ncbi:acetate--CoA ligase [Acidipropionibacterium jensenii]|uniref:acetate--CoA ligase n=1 Tax=Acidipropionibacterium jensenii TaxID=1749 RepID=UPI00264728C1|nr:acetate--CoA ligase [Acidipropionibacterium jensenii]MDN5995366.1 acetate--CoA ligase [Acidipropionibacterium jensenii]MDN6425879.1 acetate--CoA ligase [Acidipropionibacterium jensenii]MDN6440619.1 acetate--CoA ligase [Acidipropionibacterium jensenii]MDN6479159.1 acetate--CoA ligase [Acidipropionibacterium jensenii]MDN6512042.1 acetate--CoA ligase [Acidipropionibacterium jensenii]